MRKKMLFTMTVFIFLALTTTTVLASISYIEDDTSILSQPTTGWDLKGHSLGGLQVERGNGLVRFVLPRSVDHSTSWGLHAKVTFTDATITNVTPGTGFYILEGNWNDDQYGGSNPYNDEIDWTTEELEFWLLTNSARDGFTANVNYGFCPRMRIEYVSDSDELRYGTAIHQFEINGADYKYPMTIPLADCKFNIDIKPGSYPNSVNINEHGVIPVAILGSADFNVTSIDPSTLAFEGLTVRTKGNGDSQCSVKDVSSANMPYDEPDGFSDLVCQFVDGDGYLATGSGFASVEGKLLDGTPISGTDSINLVNE